MEKRDEIGRIVSLIFNIRQLLHEKLAGKDEKKVSYLKCMTLYFVDKNKPLMKEIADYLAITPPSATSLIDSLIKDGLVRREANKDDRRIVQILITSRGRIYLKNTNELIFQRMRKGLEDLTAYEQKELIKILSKIVKSYKK